MHSTEPQSYLVRLIVAGLQQIVAHADTFRSAIALINADVTRRFGWDAIEHSVTTGDYVRLTTTAGFEIEYQILPHDESVPEHEPSAEDVDNAEGHGTLPMTQAALRALAETEGVDAK